MEKSLVRRTRSTTWSTTSPQSSDPSNWWRTAHGFPALVMVGCWPLGAKEIIVNIISLKRRRDTNLKCMFSFVASSATHVRAMNSWKIKPGREAISEGTRCSWRQEQRELPGDPITKKCRKRLCCHPSQASDQWHGDTHHWWTRCLDSMLNTARYKATMIFVSRNALLMVLFGTGEVEL